MTWKEKKNGLVEKSKEGKKVYASIVDYMYSNFLIVKFVNYLIYCACIWKILCSSEMVMTIDCGFNLIFAWELP